MVRTSTRSGGVHQPSSVSLLVSRSIANVKKCFKAEHAKAKRAQVSAKRTEEEQKRQQRFVEKCAKLRRLDAEVIEKLLERGKCTMRFKMRGAHQLVRNDWASLEDKRESMRGTSWVFCKACDDYGTDAWHNPSKLLSPEELLGGHRHQPCCTHNGARWEGGRVSLTCPELRRVPRKLPRPEYWGSACDVSLVVSPPPPPEVPDADGSLQRVDPSFPKCLRNLCAKLPTPDAALAAAAMVSQASEHVYNQETPLECAQRQKAHSHKDVLAMNDEVFYKHLRDHNVEPEEAFQEVLKRKRLIHAGKSDAYEPPQMGHLILGLLNGVPVPDPAPPEGKGATPPGNDEADVYAPWIHNPWQTYLKHRAVANSVIVEALASSSVCA